MFIHNIYNVGSLSSVLLIRHIDLSVKQNNGIVHLLANQQLNRDPSLKRANHPSH
jgi:hypothetical protein